MKLRDDYLMQSAAVVYLRACGWNVDNRDASPLLVDEAVRKFDGGPGGFKKWALEYADNGCGIKG